MSRTWIGASLLNLLTSRACLFVYTGSRPCCPSADFVQRWLSAWSEAGSAKTQSHASLGTVIWVRVPPIASAPVERHVVDGQKRLVASVVLQAALRDELVEARSTDERWVGAMALLRRSLVTAAPPPRLRLAGTEGEVLAAVLRGDTHDLPRGSHVAQTYRVMRTFMLVDEQLDPCSILVSLRRATVDIIELNHAPVPTRQTGLFERLNKQGALLDADALGSAGGSGVNAPMCWTGAEE